MAELFTMDRVRRSMEELDALIERPQPIHSDGGGGGSERLEMNIGERLASLEGGTSTLKWAAGFVSSALLGAMALLLGGMGWLVVQSFELQSSVDALGTRMDALPAEINANLLELNRTLADSITAARSSEQPSVIVIDRDSRVSPAPSPETTPPE